LLYESSAGERNMPFNQASLNTPKEWLLLEQDFPLSTFHVQFQEIAWYVSHCRKPGLLKIDDWNL
jgi:hypothetical protein